MTLTLRVGEALYAGLAVGGRSLLFLAMLNVVGCGDDDHGNQNQQDAAVILDATTGGDGSQVDAAGQADAAMPVDCVFADLTSWTPVAPMPGPRESFATVGHGEHLLVVGGWTQTGATAEVIAAAAAPDGTLGAWQVTTPLPVGLEHLAAVVSGDHVLVTGGDDGAAGHAEVYAATVTDGQVGAWTETTPLPQMRVWHAGAAHTDGGYVYVIGGMQGFGPVMDTVYRGTLDGAGGVTGWVEDRALGQAIFGHAAFVVADHLYVVGGATSMSAAVAGVQRAPIGGDGSLGPWEALQDLPDATMTPGALPVGAQLLVVAGLLDFTTATGGAQSLPLAPGATSWTSQIPLPDTRFGHGVVRVDAFAYVLGGWRTWTSQPGAMQAGVYAARICE